MRIILTGQFVDALGRTYNLIGEPANDLGNGKFLIVREIPVTVWEAIN